MLLGALRLPRPTTTLVMVIFGDFRRPFPRSGALFRGLKLAPHRTRRGDFNDGTSELTIDGSDKNRDRGRGTERNRKMIQLGSRRGFSVLLRRDFCANRFVVEKLFR